MAVDDVQKRSCHTQGSSEHLKAEDDRTQEYTTSAVYLYTLYTESQPIRMQTEGPVCKIGNLSSVATL